MLIRNILLASILSTTLLACTDDPADVGDELTDPDGKGDGFGVALVEHQLATESRRPELTLQDDAFIYYLMFTEDDEKADPQTRSLLRVRKAGGSAAEKVATLPLSFVTHAALGGNDIFLQDNDALYRVAKTGGDTTTVASFPGSWALAADATGAYVAHQVVENDQFFQRITKVTAGAQLPLARATFVTSMVSDATSLYWLDETQPNPAIGCGKNAGAAHRIGKNGGVDTTLAIGINCPLTIAADSSGVYYTNWAMVGPGLPVVRLPVFGLPQVLGFAGASEIALQPSHVSWISPELKLSRRAKAFGIARDVAPGVNVGQVQADASALYFWRGNETNSEFELVRLSAN